MNIDWTIGPSVTYTERNHVGEGSSPKFFEDRA
jgi:hypothetical protein